ncbi:MAG: TIGR01212 family radical SAM protein [Spirochaetales bacterium]|nr:TIGR01212 family radical SAM protein [Spirochaetales bacterium]
MNDKQTSDDWPFYIYSNYLKKKYGCTVYRVAVDAGFSCPNRGPDRDAPGCTYCDECGSRAPYVGDKTALYDQITGALSFLRQRYQAQGFILYFQAFSNTFAPARKLRSIYDYGLSLAAFKELIVSTRPDCVDADIAALLASYKNQKRDVWVELGLQSAHNSTLNRINRGHTVEDFLTAYKLLRHYDLKIAVHLIFGLPGETETEITETIKLVASLKPAGIKIHNLHIPYNSMLFNQYLCGEITVPGSERHLEYVIKALGLLPPSTVIMRLTCDTPSSRLAAPKNFMVKQQFYALLKSEMLKRNLYQGSAYNN